MLFLHIFDDYHLQGILAQMKQKKWWQDNAPQALYKNDYKMALFEHAFSWSFMITLPWLILAIQNNNPVYYVLLIIFYFVNTFFHACIDDLKANALQINLIDDQLLHFLQIFTTWAIFVLSGV